jgi:NaMN:DMB phosphoribosyltransferase
MKMEGQVSKATLDLSDSSRDSMVADANMAMSRAAESAARLDVDLDGFMQTAFAAYIRANPATRERIEATHLLAQLDDMRRRGVLATA